MVDFIDFRNYVEELVQMLRCVSCRNYNCTNQGHSITCTMQVHITNCKDTSCCYKWCEHHRAAVKHVNECKGDCTKNSDCPTLREFMKRWTLRPNSILLTAYQCMPHAVAATSRLALSESDEVNKHRGCINPALTPREICPVCLRRDIPRAVIRCKCENHITGASVCYLDSGSNTDSDSDTDSGSKLVCSDCFNANTQEANDANKRVMRTLPEVTVCVSCTGHITPSTPAYIHMNGAILHKDNTSMTGAVRIF